MIELTAAATFALLAVAYVLQPLRRKSSDLENVEPPESELDGGDSGERANHG
jgi:hypothetical protein